MAKLRLGESYWLDGHARPARHRAVERDLDVVVVGGGVTGCALAHFLAAAGARIGLFESR